jgi:septal ring factor EnvC (AmiA/AmiB activator)
VPVQRLLPSSTLAVWEAPQVQVMETPFAIYDALTSIEVPPEKVRAVVQSMERDMAMFATRSQFSALDEHSAARYEILRAELAASRERTDHFARSFEQIARQFAEVDKRFEQVDKRFERVDKRFDHVDQRLELLRSEMQAMERRIELKLTVRMGAFITAAVGVTATIVTLLHG